MFSMLIVLAALGPAGFAPDSATLAVIRGATRVEAFRLVERRSSAVGARPAIEPPEWARQHSVMRSARLPGALDRELAVAFADSLAYHSGVGLMWCIDPPPPVCCAFRFEGPRGRAWVRWWLPLQAVEVWRDGERAREAAVRLPGSLVPRVVALLAPEVADPYAAAFKPQPVPAVPRSEPFTSAVRRPRYLGPTSIRPLPPGAPTVVMLDVLVRADGSVKSVTLARGAGARDSAVAAVVRSARFEPGVDARGQPVLARVALSIPVP